jgi:biotin carboxylase
MTLLILNRRPIVDRIPDWLDEIDRDLVLITARSSVTGEALSRCRHRYRDIVTVDDYDHPAVDDLILQTARQHRAARIISSAEVDVIRAAKVRGALSLPGQTPVSARVYRDKFQMKSLLAQAGLRVAPMRRLVAAGDLHDMLRSHGLPLVVKPRCGGGSVGVRVLSRIEDVDDAAARLPNQADEQFLVEAYVSGDFFTVDGLMSDGGVLQIWPSRTSPNLSTVAQCSPLLSWMLPRSDDLHRRISDFVGAVITALPATTEVTAFHAEVFHTPDDELVLCEIACRPGGCGHVPVYEDALGVNLYAATLRGQAGCTDLPIDMTAQPNAMGGFVWLPPRAGVLRELPGACPVDGVYRYATSGKIGTRYGGAKAVSDNIAQVLVRGPSDRSVEDPVRAIAAWWEKACMWDDVKAL